MGTPRRPGRGPAGRALAGLLLVLGVAAAGGSHLLHDARVERVRAAAEDRAVEYADAVLAPLLDPGLVAKPITGSAQTQVLAAIGRVTRSDDVARVRLWSSAGQLLFSTDRQDPVGSRSSREVRAAARGSGAIVSRVELEDLGKAGEPLFLTLVPMRVGSDPAGAIAQIDQGLEKIDQQAREPAATVRVAGYVTAGLGLLLLLVSVLVAGKDKGKAGGFQSSPFNIAVSPDTATLTAKLEKSETAREAMEEQLTQLRTQVAQGDQRGSERTRALEDHLRETEERAKELEVRLREADGRAAESDRVVKDALRRAEEAEGTAEQLRQASTEALQRAERAEAGGAELKSQLGALERRNQESERRAAEAERDASSAGELGSNLEAARLDLDAVRAHESELEEALSAARARIAQLERADQAEEAASPVAAGPDGGPADAFAGQAVDLTEQLQAARTRIAELETEVASLRIGGGDVDGPSLRYRLARSAETKKRSSSDPEHMWS